MAPPERVVVELVDEVGVLAGAAADLLMQGADVPAAVRVEVV